MEEDLKRMAPGLQQYAFTLTRDKMDADDLVQDTMLKVVLRKGQYASAKGAFTTWVYRIMLNTFIDYSRKGKVRTEPLEVVLDGHNDDDKPMGYAAVVGREELGYYDMDYAHLVDLVYQVPNGYLLFMRNDGYSYEEISNIFGIPLGTVKAKLHKVRSEMAKLLNMHLGEDGKMKSLHEVGVTLKPRKRRWKSERRNHIIELLSAGREVDEVVQHTGASEEYVRKVRAAERRKGRASI